jgi:hypothetical protein
MNNIKIVEWLLRVGVGGTFIGHGAFALLGKEKFLKWIMEFTGADLALGAKLLLTVGIVDVLVGLIILIKPIRGILLWAIIWTSWTSIMRMLPFIGDPIWELFEKIIAPTSALALLLLLGWPKNLKDWFR